MMTNDKQNNDSKMCDRLKKLGYAQSKHVRIYGQEYRVLSDPFPQASGVAVKAVSEGETEIRTLPLPLPILAMASKE